MECTCKDCGKDFSGKFKLKRCKTCRKSWFTEHLPEFIVAILIALKIKGIIDWINESTKQSEDMYSYENDCDIEDTSDDLASTTHEPGEKYWNPATQNWEMDGLPYTYRVTYIDLRDMKEKTKDYTDIDNGYEDCEYYEKSGYAANVRWYHIPPNSCNESES